MKYIKAYESIVEPQINDYVVAYRPYRVEKDTHLDPITIDFTEYVMEVGKVYNVYESLSTPRITYNVYFLNSDTRYIRTDKHILFSSPNRKEAEEHLKAILNSNKYNI